MTSGMDDKDTTDNAKVLRPDETPAPPAAHHDIHPSEPAASVAGTSSETPFADHRQKSLWTASDARGPLETAEDDREPEAGVHTAEDPPIVTDRSAASSAGRNASSAASASGTASSASSHDRGLSGSAASRKRSPWPIAAGIVVGALIGAGSALVAQSQGLTGASNGPTDAQVAALSSRVDALEKRPAAAPSDQGLSSAVDELKRQTAALSDKVDAVAKSAGDKGSAPADGDVAALQQNVASLQQSVEALKAQTKQASSSDHGTDEKVAALTSELAGLKSTASQAQASLAGVKDDQKRLSDKVAAPALAVAADSLVRQVDQGEPYAAQLDALVALGADSGKLTVLRQYADRGVLSSKGLAQKFEPYAEPIAATAQKVPANATFVDRLKSGMMNLVSIRSVDDTSGTDLPSRVARIRLDLAHEDVADAVATWDALPADAKAKSEPWVALARATAGVKAAARDLQHDAITALSVKKS